MATRGRKPKPVAEKARKGNPGKRSLTPIVPPSPGRELLCPSYVDADEIAAAYWAWYTAHTAPGHLDAIDSHALAQLCVYQALWDRNVEAMRSGGLTAESVTTRGEDTVKVEIRGHPMMREMARLTDLIRKLSADLCLTVADRNRVLDGNGGQHGGIPPVENKAAKFVR